MREGGVVAQGLLTDTLTSENLTNTFGVPLLVSHDDGRFTARAA
jgi:iron complex transport system ATP-binding protein